MRYFILLPSGRVCTHVRQRLHDAGIQANSHYAPLHTSPAGLRSKSCLPIFKSHIYPFIGFTGDLRQKTGGKAFPQCSFDHWQEFGGDPFEEGSKCETICIAIRKRKGINENMPKFDKFYDKL